jgi:hypothetical protein
VLFADAEIGPVLERALAQAEAVRIALAPIGAQTKTAVPALTNALKDECCPGPRRSRRLVLDRPGGRGCGSCLERGA